MKNLWNWFAKPPVDGPAAILILRLMTGAVFFWEGILKFVHEIRSEYAQMLTCIFYCIVGPGILSLDARLRKKSQPQVAEFQTPQKPILREPRRDRDYSNLSH